MSDDHSRDAPAYLGFALDPGYKKFADELRKYTYKKRPRAFDLDLTATEITDQRALPAPKEPQPPVMRSPEGKA